MRKLFISTILVLIVASFSYASSFDYNGQSNKEDLITKKSREGDVLKQSEAPLKSREGDVLRKASAFL